MVQHWKKERPAGVVEYMSGDRKFMVVAYEEVDADLQPTFREEWRRVAAFEVVVD